MTRSASCRCSNRRTARSPAFGPTHFNYQPDTGFSGTDIVTYVLRDGHGLVSSGRVTVQVDTGAAGPQTPRPGHRLFRGVSGVAVSGSRWRICWSTTASPQGQPMTVVAVSQPPTDGVLTGTCGGRVHVHAVGGAASFVGQDFDLAYLVVDPDGHVAQETIRIRILAAGDTNRAPVAVPDTASSARCRGAGDPVGATTSTPTVTRSAIVSVHQPAHGTITSVRPNPLQLQPDAGFSGTDTVTYVLRDGHGLLGTGLVAIRVNTTGNQPPVAGSAQLHGSGRRNDDDHAQRRRPGGRSRSRGPSSRRPPASLTGDAHRRRTRRSPTRRPPTGRTDAFVYEVSDGTLTARGTIQITGRAGRTSPRSPTTTPPSPRRSARSPSTSSPATPTPTSDDLTIAGADQRRRAAPSSCSSDRVHVHAEPRLLRHGHVHVHRRRRLRRRRHRHGDGHRRAVADRVEPQPGAGRRPGLAPRRSGSRDIPYERMRELDVDVVQRPVAAAGAVAATGADAATGAVRATGAARRLRPDAPPGADAAAGAAVRDPRRLPRRLAGAAGGHVARRTTDAGHHVRGVPHALRPARPADPGAARPHARGRVVLRRHRHSPTPARPRCCSARPRWSTSASATTRGATARGRHRGRRPPAPRSASRRPRRCSSSTSTRTRRPILAAHPDLRRIPLAANVAVFVDAPVLDARLNELNLFATAIGQISVAAAFAASPAVGSVRIADIPVDDTNPDDGGYGRRDLVVDCSGAFTCPSGSTLADAAAAGALVAGGRLQDVGRAFVDHTVAGDPADLGRRRSAPRCRRPSTSTT